MLLLACSVTHVELGGEPDGGVGDAGVDGAIDATGAPWSPICPADVPADGTPCTVVNLRCEYGTSAWPICNTIAYCELSPLRFTITAPDPRCPLPAPVNPAACPASYASISNAESCAGTGLAIGDQCAYPDGACTCGEVGSQMSPPRWSCAPIPAGCPPTPPRFGSACSVQGLQCAYHPCDPTGAQAFCQGGVWNGSTGGCVGVANGADGG